MREREPFFVYVLPHYGPTALYHTAWEKAEKDYISVHYGSGKDMVRVSSVAMESPNIQASEFDKLCKCQLFYRYFKGCWWQHATIAINTLICALNIANDDRFCDGEMYTSNHVTRIYTVLICSGNVLFSFFRAVYARYCIVYGWLIHFSEKHKSVPMYNYMQQLELVLCFHWHV